MGQITMTLECNNLMNHVFDWCHQHQVYDRTAEEILTQTIRDIISDHPTAQEDKLTITIRKSLRKQLSNRGLSIGHIDRFWFNRGVLLIRLHEGVSLGDSYLLGEPHG